MRVGSLPAHRAFIGWTFCASAVAFATGCGSSSTSAAPGDAGGHVDAHTLLGATDAASHADLDGGQTLPSLDGGAAHDGTSMPSCVPAIPTVAWTSPYAGWSNGIPTDPRFFPIAVWLQGSWHASELAALGINVYVGNNAGTDSLASSDLATLKAKGIYAIVGQDSVGLASIHDPTIVGWWMTPDEPDNAQPVSGGGYGPPVSPSTLVTRYSDYKKADPTRPIFLGLGQGVAYDNWEGRGSSAPPESAYPAASDIVAFDIYPYNNCGGDMNERGTCSQFWLNAFGVDRLHQWSNRNQAVWTDIETTVIAAKTTNGPTPTETASEVWLSLIHAANGVVYFIDTWNPSFREDGIFADSAMTTAVTILNQQIKSLAPELNSGTIPGIVTVASSNAAAPIDTMVKVNGASLYIFSAIARSGAATGSYAIAGMTGSANATVVGENRTLNVIGGAFSDTFAPNGVHIYEIDLSTAVCP